MSLGGDLTGLGSIGDVLVNWWLTVRKDKEIRAWVKYWSSLLVSGLVKALGAGLFAIAAAWFGVSSVSPIGRDLIQSLPKAFITQMQEHPDQVTIVGSEAEKK